MFTKNQEKTMLNIYFKLNNHDDYKNGWTAYFSDSREPLVNSTVCYQSVINQTLTVSAN